MTIKLIQVNNLKGKVKHYKLKTFIKKLNKGLINVEGSNITLVKAKLYVK